MNMKITLSVLFEALIILGHDRVWMEESEFEHIYGYGCYREIHTWDDRTVAWWDDADDTWYLSTEVDVITPFLGPLPKKEGELSEEECFQLMTLGRY